MDIFSPISMPTLSRTQERAELQQLNDRFAAYVQRVRQLAEQSHQVDSTAMLKSTKTLEVEIHNLKNMYEQELDKLRKEVEICSGERSSLHVQVNKQLQCSAELQDRLNVETAKNSKLQDEVNAYQSRVSGLEAEIQDLRIASTRPQADVDRLQRNIENQTREMETWRHRYEHEQVARQEAENKIQQLMQKYEFNDKVNNERVGELNTRIESSAATILSLEAKIRDLSKADISVSELLKQVRDSAEAELKKFQIESEEQYNRNLTALKAQLDSEAKGREELVTERTQLRGSVGELKARIRSLEGQVANLEHQKQTLEDAVAVERNRAADNARSLEQKLREVQDLLVVKMREVTMAREHNIPLKAEIEALKVLLEEEEKRLRVPLRVAGIGGAVSTTDPLSLLTSYNITSDLATTANNTANMATAVSSSLAHISQPLTTTTLPTQPITGSGTITASVSGTVAPQVVSFADPAPLYTTSAPMTQTYGSEVLQGTGSLAMGVGSTAGGGDALWTSPRYDTEMDPSMYGFTNTTPLAKYSYETSPGLSRLAMEPSASAMARSRSAPEQGTSSPELTDTEVERQRYMQLCSGNVGQGYSYDMMTNDLQRDAFQARPKTTPMRSERSLTDLYHDYTVSTSSAIGDVKIFEVQQDGKYVRLLNDGVQEIEFGGYMLQQNVGGHPVAVYRFPPRTKFGPNCTITVYAGCSDHKLHNPPQDFVWKEQQKWGTGPECTTILCRPNGQAVAWTTAAHRFTRDPFNDGQSEADDDATKADDDKQTIDGVDDESLTEISVNVNEPKPEPVYLRREKQQPPSLQANKHPHGNTAAVSVHPHTGQPRPYRYGNDNSSKNRQSRSQSTRPDPVPGQPYAGAAAQKMGSAPLCKFVPGVSTQGSPGIRVSGKSESSGGKGGEVPSPFMKPHSRFQSGLEQVQSQHHKDFLPPMPRPPVFSTW
ncbi:uncharacterized protein LOC143286862 isoform X2 [Babylonia areolata]|uniref:uncharacterized protein LOC143286862 isoform X2 n=1 Tax=Babylonia areolata TaxID=304850 RepID=UPI003FD37444